MQPTENPTQHYFGTFTHINPHIPRHGADKSPMSSRKRYSEIRCAAFSRVGIVMALGLVAVAITTLLALFPLAVKTDRDSEEETRATLIASGIMESLTLGKNEGTIRLASGMINDLPDWIMIVQKGNTVISVAYDSSCEPLRKLSDSESDNPISDQRIVAVASLRLISNATTPGILTAEVAVSSPPSAPLEERTIQRFVRLITSP